MKLTKQWKGLKVLKNAAVEFVWVVNAKEKVMADHLKLEIIGLGKMKLHEAKVWMKPMLNFKELQEFKHAGDDVRTITPSYLDCKYDEHESRWREVQ